ncbi:MAG: hypothetical protein R2795_06005 [Saprospiraceae bacterium]
MKSCHASACYWQESTTREGRFRSSLRRFLKYNVFIFVLMMFGIGGSFLWKISVIWGTILAFRVIPYTEMCPRIARKKNPRLTPVSNMAALVNQAGGIKTWCKRRRKISKN